MLLVYSKHTVYKEPLLIETLKHGKNKLFGLDILGKPPLA